MKYRYFMGGMFFPTDGEEYEINIPSPLLHESEAEAMKDQCFGYRFIQIDGQSEPVIAVFEKEKWCGGVDEKGKYIKSWVEGNVEKIYSFDEFKKAGGYIRMLKPDLKGKGFIDGNTDFLDTDKTFKDVFPNIEKNKLYYIDNESYYIGEIECDK